MNGINEDVRIARIIAEKIDEGRLDHPGFYKNGRLSAALRNLLALIDGQANVRSSSEHSSALNTLARMFHNGEELEGPDGMAVSVDIALWHEASEAFDVLIGDCDAETLADSTEAQPTKGDGQAAPRPLIARPIAEWHEDDGPAMWWAWCGREWAGEPAWCGTPNDCDWPGYHTHWTPHPAMPMQPTKGVGE